MDIGYLYEPIYLIICSIVLVIAVQKFGFCAEDDFNYSEGYSFGGIFLSLMLSLFIGLRPISLAFGDMGAYSTLYGMNVGAPFKFSIHKENFIFDNILPLYASLKLPVSIYFFTIAFIFFVPMYMACVKLFPRYSFIAFVTWLTAFSTFGAAVNGIKAGAACSIFMLAIAYREKLPVSILLAVISVGFHHSMKVVFFAYIISLFYKNLKYYYLLWGFSLLMAILHVGFFQSLFAQFADESGYQYLTSTTGYLTGFRLDFILYSSSPILLGYWIIKRKRVVITETYSLLLRLYLLTNSVWMLCMYASFTNRIAGLSWFLYSTVLLCPFLSFYWSKDQLLLGKKIALIHMSFTLFMAFMS